MAIFDEIKKSLKGCDMSDTYCDKCHYKDHYPNACIKQLHQDAGNFIREAFEMVEFFKKGN